MSHIPFDSQSITVKFVGDDFGFLSSIFSGICCKGSGSLTMNFVSRKPPLPRVVLTSCTIHSMIDLSGVLCNRSSTYIDFDTTSRTMGKAWASSSVRRRAYVVELAQNTPPPNKKSCGTSWLRHPLAIRIASNHALVQVYVPASTWPEYLPSLCSDTIWTVGAHRNSLLQRSGPWKHSLFRLNPWYLAAHSNTMRSLEVAPLRTEWCGKYHTAPSSRPSCSLGSNSACPSQTSFCTFSLFMAYISVLPSFFRVLSNSFSAE